MKSQNLSHSGCAPPFVQNKRPIIHTKLQQRFDSVFSALRSRPYAMIVGVTPATSRRPGETASRFS